MGRWGRGRGERYRGFDLAQADWSVEVRVRFDFIRIVSAAGSCLVHSQHPRAQLQSHWNHPRAPLLRPLPSAHIAQPPSVVMGCGADPRITRSCGTVGTSFFSRDLRLGGATNACHCAEICWLCIVQLRVAGDGVDSAVPGC